MFILIGRYSINTDQIKMVCFDARDIETDAVGIKVVLGVGESLFFPYDNHPADADVLDWFMREADWDGIEGESCGRPVDIQSYWSRAMTGVGTGHDATA